MMASVRTKVMLHPVARPASLAIRRQPLTSTVKCRSQVSHRDMTYPQVPYEKGENVGGKTFSQFDMKNRVFVVTGAASILPQTQERFALLSIKADR